MNPFNPIANYFLDNEWDWQRITLASAFFVASAVASLYLGFGRDGLISNIGAIASAVPFVGSAITYLIRK